MTKEGLNLIKKCEGYRPKAYRCPAGVWTIGYGHTRGVKEGDTVTEAQAEDMLKQDVRYAENSVGMMVSRRLTEHQLDALVSFAYNLGVGALRKSTLLRMVNADPDDPKIRDEFGRWVNAGGRRLEGLVRRRRMEADLYFSE